MKTVINVPLVLAVEPDLRQGALLKRVIGDGVHAELILVDSRDAAIAALSARVPDVILLTALLSPRDEDEMVAYLRTLEGADHVQTHTIPQLASGAQGRSEPAAQGTLLGKFRRKKEAQEPIAGCDPALFADEVRAFLARAAELKAHAAAAPQSRESVKKGAKKRSAAQGEDAVTPAADADAEAAAGSAWSSPFEWRRADPINEPAPKPARPSLVTSAPLAVLAEEEEERRSAREAEAERARAAADRVAADRAAAEVAAERERARAEAKAAAEAKATADAAAKREQERKRLEAEAAAKREEERKRLEAEAAAKREAERRRLEAEAAAKREVERKRLEAEAAAKREVERKRLEAEAAAKREAERKRLEAEAAAKREAERQRLEAEAAAARERVRAEAELAARREQERKRLEAQAAAEKVRLEAEAAARREIERLRVEAEAAAERQRLEAEAAAERMRIEAAAKQRQRLEAEAAERRDQERVAREQAERAAADRAAADRAAELEPDPDAFADFREDAPSILGLMPLALWAKREESAVADGDAPAPVARNADDLRELIEGLALPPNVAGVSYARGCRIRRVRVVASGVLPPTKGPVIVSKRALDELRAGN